MRGLGGGGSKRVGWGGGSKWGGLEWGGSGGGGGAHAPKAKSRSITGSPYLPLPSL